MENRRRFFEEYAVANGFDPLNASNWYSQSRDKIMATKVLFPLSPLLPLPSLSLLSSTLLDLLKRKKSNIFVIGIYEDIVIS